ncbi:hypothetical protein [Carboxylicivirga marina]|uniref:hypothetical protein n=1 Tax=Carboxylicivirga marina TaxID=2800988 RepID=UPI0025918A02|nr:hypothetical protein [uncultured Carboxylicivirga sp.]
MGRKQLFVFLFLVGLSFVVEGKGKTIQYKIWNLQSYEGKVTFESQNGYNYERFSYDVINSGYKSSYAGGVEFNARNYIWHPSFLNVNFGIKYNLSSDKHNHTMYLDRSDVTDLKAGYVEMIVFNSRPLTIKTNINVGETITNRENYSNIHTKNKSYGANLMFKNKIVPIRFSVSKVSSIQDEIQTNRLFLYENTLIRTVGSKSFTERDDSYFDVSYKTRLRESNVFSTINNSIFNASFRNSLDIGDSDRYKLNTSIRNRMQEGSSSNKTLTINESLSLILPENFSLKTSYVFMDNLYTNGKSTQNQSSSNLHHQLYLSLSSNVFFNYLNAKYPELERSEVEGGFNFDYKKKIPFGELNLGYRYSNKSVDVSSLDVEVDVFDEEKVLNDGELVMLANPYININSIVVTDVSNTVYYQPYIDYVLIERGNFIELQRVAGGLIPNNSPVHIDYTAHLPGSNSFKLNTNLFSARVSFFDSFLNLYFRMFHNDYEDIQNVDLGILNFLSQNIYGIRIGSNRIEGGVEYEKYNSNLTPYNQIKYFARATETFNKINISLNGSYQKINYLTDIESKEYINISGNATYNLNSFSRINFNTAYNLQSGSNININVFNAKCLYDLRIRQLTASVGIEYFDKTYFGDEYDFFRFSLKLLRRF